MQHQYKFALSVARYLEENDASLTPIPDLKPLYPVLPAANADVPLKHDDVANDNANKSDYDDWIQEEREEEREEESFESLHTTTPSAPSLQQNPSENPQFCEKQKASTEYVKISESHHHHHHHHHYAPRTFEPFLVTPSSWTNGNRTIIVNNNNNNDRENGNGKQTDLQKKADEETEENQKNSPIAAAAVIAVVSVGATVVGARLLLAQRRVQNLWNEAKTIERDCETSDFLDQFHNTFGKFRARDRIYSASGATATMAALTASSLYYFNCQSDSAYFCLLGLGCLSMCSTAFSHLWYNNKSVSEAHKLHAMCKTLCEKAQ